VPRSRPQPEFEFLVDRSLGTRIVPDGLRQAGYVVHTLASVYGEKQAQRVTDTVWIERAGREGWIVLTADDAIRRNELERAAVQSNSVQLFCITSAKLTGTEQRDRLLRHIHRILQRSQKPGPFIYGVYEKTVEILWRPNDGSNSAK
jgi:hypothetical protein